MPTETEKPTRKPPERTQLSGDLQAAAKIDRVLNKMRPAMAIATLEYLLGIYETKAGRAEVAKATEPGK